MRNIYVVILIFLSMACAVAAKEQKGYLSVKNSNFNFGLFPKKQVRSCVFILQNTGTKPVLLENVTTSCNCTAVKYSSTTYSAYGKTAYLTVYYNGKNYDAGHFKKSIDINSTAENSTLRLFISGTTTK